MADRIWAHCDACGQTWAVLELPAALRIAARAMARATCPKCGTVGKRIKMATEAQIDEIMSRPVTLIDDRGG